MIESGRRRPSLRLLAKIADVIGLDGQLAFVLAHPEGREFINGTIPKPKPKTKVDPSWERFLRNQKLLEHLRVTEQEMCALEQLSLLGPVTSMKSFVAILTLIRDEVTVAEDNSARRCDQGLVACKLKLARIEIPETMQHTELAGSWQVDCASAKSPQVQRITNCP